MLVGRTGVTVRNGTVRAFDVGVVIEGGSGNTVEAVNAIDNISFTGTTNRGGDGIAILSSSNNRILRSNAVNNGPFSGIGIITGDPDHPAIPPALANNNVLQANRVTNNVACRRNGLCDNDGIRIEPRAGSGCLTGPLCPGPGNRIVGNQVVGNGLDGISLFADTADNVVRNNSVEGNGFYRTTARRGSGIIVFTRSTRNVVENNLVTGNADSGIDIRPPLSTFPGATNNRIVNNTAVGNSVLPFIPSPVFGPSFDLKDANPNCDANFWFANRYRTFNQPCVTTGGQQV